VADANLGLVQLEGMDASEARAFALIGAGVVEAMGVCTVQLRAGLIYSNEVFFDRSELLRALRASRP